MEEKHICMIPFSKTNLDQIKGYDGFISPEGYFYKVCKRDAIDDIHDYFAEMYVYLKHDQDINKVYEEFQARKPDFRNIHLAPKDILINLYSWVNYEYYKSGMVEVTPPNPKYINKKINDKQFLMLVDLVNLNGDKMESLNKVFKSEYSVNENEYLECGLKR